MSEDIEKTGKKEARKAGLLRRLEKLDHRAFLFCYWKTKNPLFDIAMPILSLAANRGLLHALTAIAIISFGEKTEQFHNERFFAVGSMLAAAFGAGVVAEMTIKAVWKRKRPFQKLEGVTARVPSRRLLKRPSFPSGHAAGYMGGVTALCYFYPQWTPALLALGLAGSYSRIYNGVHFPSDVIAGVMLGSACGLAAPPVIMMFFGS